MQVLLSKQYDIKLKSGDSNNIRRMTGAEGIATAIMQCALNPKDKNWVNAVKFALQLGDEDKSKLEKDLIKANKNLINANKKLIEARISEIKAAASDPLEVEDDNFLEALSGTAAADWSGAVNSNSADEEESEGEDEEA